MALADRVAAADADPRTEVGQVGSALNRMLGHVESALVSRQRSEDKVRQFVADASATSCARRSRRSAATPS